MFIHDISYYLVKISQKLFRSFRVIRLQEDIRTYKIKRKKTFDKYIDNKVHFKCIKKIQCSQWGIYLDIIEQDIRAHNSRNSSISF